MARTPRKGDTFRYRGGEPIGTLVHGTEVTIRDVVDAGETGAHDDSEDAVVVEWSTPANVIVGADDEGHAVFGAGHELRAVSVGLAALDDGFELTAEAPPEEDEEVTDDAG